MRSSPVLAVYIGLFGGKIVGLIKPLVGGMTTLSITLLRVALSTTEAKHELQGLAV